MSYYTFNMLNKMNKIQSLCRFPQFAIAIFFTALAGIAYASENTLDLSPPSSRLYTQDSKSFLLAVNEADAEKIKPVNTTLKPATDFKPPLFSASKAHQFLGIGTIVMAGLTALSHPEECEGNCSTSAPREVNGRHATLAKTTLALAAATIATGLYAHWNDFSLEDGLSDPDNLHVLFGITGAALLAYAVNLSANSSVPVNHAGIAEAGALGMVVAIKLNW